MTDPTIDPTTPPALRAAARSCLDAALVAVDPERLVREALGRDGDALVLRTPTGERTHRGPVLLVGAGKAGPGMLRGACAVVGACAGVMVVPHGSAAPGPPGVEVLAAAHPVPDAASEGAARRVLAAVESAAADTLVLVLLSGGGSALLAAPAEGLTLADVRDVTGALLRSGADIVAVNAVRKHCSRLQGGGLARAAQRAQGIWTLVLSDVVGDDPSTIASGPTAADPSTYADALRVLERWLAAADVPPRVRAHLAAGRAGHAVETVKPGDPVLARAAMHVLAGNRTAVAAAAERARVLGHAAAVIAEALLGDAADAGRAIASRLAAAPRDRPVAVVAGGETTVRVVAGGRGGRSQQLALAAALALAGQPGVLLAAGTDGIDGPTDAAGACVDGGTVARARALGFDAAAALATTDSHALLAATGDLLRTGPTGTNVADLVVALRPAC